MSGSPSGAEESPRPDFSGSSPIETLVKRAAAGDRDALQRLMLHHFDDLHGYVSPRIPTSLRSVVDADDVVQQTFVQAFRSISTFEPESKESFLAWLKLIAKRKLIDCEKAQARKKRGGDLERTNPTADERSRGMVAFIELLSAGDETASRMMQRDEALQALEVAIAGLPPDYRDAIRLHYLEGKNLETVAREMDRTSGAVRGLLDRGRKKLQEAMGQLSKYVTRL